MTVAATAETRHEFDRDRPRAAMRDDDAPAIGVITETRNFEALRGEWSELLDASSAHSIFLTWEWLFAWWKHLGGERQLSIITVRSRRDGQLLGVAPFSKTRRGLLEFLATGAVSSDHLDVIARRGVEDLVLDSLIEHLVARGTPLKLVHYDRGTSLVDELSRRLQERGWHSVEAALARAPFIDLTGTTWESYLETLSGNDRRAIRRREGKLAREFAVRIETANTEDDRRRHLALLFDLHERGWRERGGSAAFGRTAVRAFHDEATRHMLERGWLRLFVQFLDDKPVAARYGFRLGDTYYSYQGGFDPDYASQGIGILTFAAAIRSSIEEGAAEHDLLAGDDEYKCRLAPRSRELGRLELYPPSARWTVFRAVLAIIRSMRKSSS